MIPKTTRTVAAFVALSVAAVAGYWYWSPFLALNSMKSAAQKRDADEFNQYVDYPKLRESLKGQFNARLADVMGKSSGGTGMEQAGAALGAMLGLAMVDRMIDAMVRPEMVMRAMSEAKLQNPASTAHGSASDAQDKTRDLTWTIERKGSDRVIAYGNRQAQDPGEPRAGFVFDRTGFASWKLTEIRLPAEK